MYTCARRSSILKAYSIRIALPRHRLHGCACTSPLAHFYIHHADSSIRELHPFTTISNLGAENRITPLEQDDLHIQFLFRKRGLTNQPPENPSINDGFAAAVLNIFSPHTRKKYQWTDQLAQLADIDPTTSRRSSAISLEPVSRHPSAAAFAASHPHPTTDIQLRLEGPYFTPADPAKYRTVVCLVAGTGISGAIALAAGFKENGRLTATEDYICEELMSQGCQPDPEIELRGTVWKKCIVVWSVKQDTFVDLPFLIPEEGLELVVQYTGSGMVRVNLLEMLQGICEENPGSMWVYISGPNAFIAAAEEACKQVPGVDYYGARW